MLNEEQFNLFSQIQTSQTGGQPYSDTSPYLWWVFTDLGIGNQIAPHLEAVWPDLAIYWTLGKFLKPLVTLNLPKSLTFLRNFCKDVKIYHFSSKIIFGQIL